MDDYFVLFAFGTRGDVEPLLHLSSRLRAVYSNLSVTIVSHLGHKAWLSPTTAANFARIKYVSLPPTRNWDARNASPSKSWISKSGPQTTRDQGSPATQPTNQAAAESTLKANPPDKRRRLSESISLGLSGDSSLHWGQCLKAAKEGLGLVEGKEPSTADKFGPEEPRRLVIHNLFALEAFHIAEFLGVPSLAASPCLVPYGAPASFKSRFSASYPDLYAALCTALAGTITWADVEHWMWPLFTERWAPLRSALRLPLLPLSQVLTQETEPLPQLLSPPDTSRQPGVRLAESPRGGHGGDPGGCHAERHTGSGTVSTTGGARSVPLLYGISEAVVDRPGYWPESVQLTGYWNAEPSLSQPLHAQRNFAPSIDLAGAHMKHICFDFGSMGRMGLLGVPHHLVQSIRAALVKLDCRGVLLTGGWQALADAAKEVMQDREPHLEVLEEGVLHADVLPACAALMCHGGAGTVAAGLRAGIPIIVCPLQFDQFFWGEKVEWMGVGVQLPAQRLLCRPDGVPAEEPVNSMKGCSSAIDGPGGRSSPMIRSGGRSVRPSVEESAAAIVSAVQECFHPDILSNCEAMAERLKSEDGSLVAATLIRSFLDGCSCSSGGRCPPLPKQAEEERPTPVGSSLLDLEKLDARTVRFPGGLTIWSCSPREATHIWEEIYQHRCYARHGVHVPPEGVVVDVGANIGLFSIWASEGRGGGVPSRVLAVEPLHPNLAMLAENVASAGFTSLVRIIPVAAGSEDSQQTFTWYPGMPGNSTAFPDAKRREQADHMDPSLWEGALEYPCRVERLSALIDREMLPAIDLLKVDVEGAELDVLEGITPSHWGVIQQVVVEVHHWNDMVSRVTDLLGRYGFSVVAEAGMAPKCSLVYAWKR
eukprot:jgi/Botrbrau1/3361/Bobra.0337s0002.1